MHRQVTIISVAFSPMAMACQRGSARAARGQHQCRATIDGEVDDLVLAPCAGTEFHEGVVKVLRCQHRCMLPLRMNPCAACKRECAGLGWFRAPQAHPTTSLSKSAHTGHPLPQREKGRSRSWMRSGGLVKQDIPYLQYLIQLDGNPYSVHKIAWSITTISPRQTGAAISRAQH